MQEEVLPDGYPVQDEKRERPWHGLGEAGQRKRSDSLHGIVGRRDRIITGSPGAENPLSGTSKRGLPSDRQACQKLGAEKGAPLQAKRLVRALPAFERQEHAQACTAHCCAEAALGSSRLPKQIESPSR